MAISMSLFQISDDVIVMGKSIPAATSTHNILLKEGCSVDRPVVTFSAVAAAIAPLNYAYIDTFGRYYYITERRSLVNGVVELTLESDPLQSFMDEIKARSATITRSASEYNGYLKDSGYNAVAYEGVQYKQFPNAMDDTTCILCTVG
jgi:hypothetical protein